MLKIVSSDNYFEKVMPSSIHPFWIAAKVTLWQVQLVITFLERAFVNQVFSSPFNIFFLF